MSKKPEFIITPVGEYIAKMKECNQRTLTQMLGVENEEDSSSDEAFHTKKAARFVAVTPSPAKARPMKRVKKNTHPKKPPKTHKHKIGDLVTSTASEIGHPEYQCGRIGGAYVFFGLIVGNPEDRSSKLFNKNPDYINVRWSAVENGHTLVKSANKDVKHEMQIVDNTVIAVQKGKLRTIVRYNNPHLDSINSFVKEAILLEFYFIEPHGWCYVHDLE